MDFIKSLRLAIEEKRLNAKQEKFVKAMDKLGREGWKKKHLAKYIYIRKYVKLTNGALPTGELVGRVFNQTRQTGGQRMKEYNYLFKINV
jgi:hypothetical protein